MIRDFDWFKKEFSSFVKDYDVEYRFFETGDFGYLNQVLFNSSKRGGEIDFWENGSLGMHMWDYEKDAELLNVFLSPEKIKEKEEVFKQLQYLI